MNDEFLYPDFITPIMKTWLQQYNFDQMDKITELGLFIWEFRHSKKYPPSRRVSFLNLPRAKLKESPVKRNYFFLEIDESTLHVYEESGVSKAGLYQAHEYTLKDPDAPTIPLTDKTKVVEILLKWWVKEYPMSGGQQNQNIAVLAMAFNDYGINKSLAGALLNHYAHQGFPLSDTTIAAIDSAYAHTSNHGTKYYEDDGIFTKGASLYSLIS